MGCGMSTGGKGGEARHQEISQQVAREREIARQVAREREINELLRHSDPSVYTPVVSAICTHCQHWIEDKQCRFTNKTWMSESSYGAAVSSKYMRSHLPTTVGMTDLLRYLRLYHEKSRIELRGDFCLEPDEEREKIGIVPGALQIRAEVQCGQRNAAKFLTQLNQKYALAECREEISTRDGKRVLVIHIFNGVPSGK